MTPSTAAVDPSLERELAAARARQLKGLFGREALARGAAVIVFFSAAVSLVLVGGTHRASPWWTYVAFAVAYAAASSIRVELGSGMALPTELVFVPMLFILPPASVPLVVAAGLALALVPDLVRGELSILRAVILPANNALFAFAPAIVILVAGEPRADWHGAAVLAVALAAQFASDFVSTSVVAAAAFDASPRQLLRPFATTIAFDALVAPIAFVGLLAERVEHGAFVLTIPLLVLLACFARERRKRFDYLLELSAAYRGTAFVLGDVIEAADAYTGAHSRGVVELSSGVGRAIGLDERELRVLELSALLHDVGKLRIPAAVLNKPGPLSREEWVLIEAHTIEGEHLLRRVGGVLAEVAAAVRSSHERWDGQGYPDGLAGERIPLASRIVCCCDAYSAMTTDRPYRRALSPEAAMRELLHCRGSQFDPVVVDALISIESARRAA
jgi:HD-GYP domain-containing protein (c-di-GMP phosphodiesterase class II)